MVASTKNVAVLGAGVIGASWAALFAAYKLQTVVYDPIAKAESGLWSEVESAYKVLAQLENVPRIGTLEDMKFLISFTTDLTTAVRHADFIQENIPEKLQMKLDLYGELEQYMKPEALILSSTSGIPPSQLQEGFKKYASNFVIGHPFNPPHLIPLVEIVGGKQTSQSTIAGAMDFYTALGKRPIQIRKEIPGHIANRLQSALFREIMYLLQNDVADVSDIDMAMEFGPGLRWGVMGPSLLMHLGGGPGGAQQYAEKFMDSLMSWYAKKNPDVNQSLVNRWVSETTDEAKKATRSTLEGMRDERLILLLNSKNKTKAT